MRKKLSLIVLVFVAIGFWLNGQSNVYGLNNPNKISVRPFLQQLTLNPDEAVKQFSLTVSNDSNFPQSFKLSAVDFGTLDETGGLALEGADSIKLDTYGLASWISLDTPELNLGANSSANVLVTIDNRGNLSPGAHYSAIIVSAAPQSKTTRNLSVNPKISSLIFLTKLGGEKYDIHLESMTNSSNLWAPPSAVNLRFKSTGNTYIIPRGIVYVKQSNKTISKGIINAQSSIVLPQTIRDFDVPLNKIAKFNSGLLFSKYTIQVDYRYDGFDRFASRSYSKVAINKSAVWFVAFIIIGLFAAKRLLKDNPRLHKIYTKRTAKSKSNK